jgi:hypothetical protein
MSKSEKFFSQGRALDKSQLEGYKSSGDKGAAEGMNAIRAAQGRPTIANTPKEFSDTINKSVGFGSESKLLDPAGRDRALKAGIGAGLSYEEADAAVSKAYNFLKGKYGDKTTPTTPTTPTSTTPTPVPTPSPSAPSSPTVPPVVPVEKGPIGQFFDNVLAGGSPERALIKGGSAIYNAKRATDIKAAKAAAEAAKAGGAVADATKVVGKAGDVGARMRDTQAGKGAAPKLVGKAGDVGARMRQTQAAKGAGGATTVADEAAGTADEAAGAADEAVKAAEKGKGAIPRLVKGAAESRLGKLAGTTARVGGKGLRLFGRGAGPLLDIIDTAQYVGGNPITGKSKEEVRAGFQSDFETLGQRFFTPKSVGEFAGAFTDAASFAKTGLGAKESVSQMMKSQRGAREADASLKNAQNVIKAQNDRRKELYPDEEFEKLPKETQRKIRQAIRKEFSDAGVQTFGRNQ